MPDEYSHQEVDGEVEEVVGDTMSKLVVLVARVGRQFSYKNLMQYTVLGAP